MPSTFVRLTIVVATAAVVGGAVALIRPPAPTPPRPPEVAAIMPARVLVTIDSSASMKGYFTGRTEFKDRLTTLIATLPQLSADTRADGTRPTAAATTAAPTATATTGAVTTTAAKAGTRRSPEVTYYFTREQGMPLHRFTGDAPALIDRVLDDKVAFGQSSMLQETLAQIRESLKADPDAVGLFITDGLMSFSNKRIDENRTITRENLVALAAKVQQALHPDRWTRDLQLNVLQYASSFTGRYYTASNDVRVLANEPRPYYIWLMGHRDRVDFLAQALRRHPALRPAHEVAMPQQARPDPRPRVLGSSARSGNWLRDRENPLRLVAVDAADQRAATFQIALTLPGLPADVATPEHLQRRLTIVPQAVEAKVRVRRAAPIDPRDAAEATGATHFLEVTVQRMQAKDAHVEIALADALPDWCAAASSDDDGDVRTALAAAATPAGATTGTTTGTAAGTATKMPQTFGLLTILTGAANAFRLDDRPVFTFVVTLRR